MKSRVRSSRPTSLVSATFALLAASVSLSSCVSTGPGPTVARPVAGEGITNPVHAANVGKIVFSKETIDRDHPSPAALTKDFTDSDRIYARFYMPTAIANHFAKDSDGGTYLATGIDVRLLVDGQSSKEWAYELDGIADERGQDSTRSVPINPAEDPEERAPSLAAAAKWASFVRTLSPGKHVIRMTMITRAGSFRSDTPAAVGELTLERSTDPVKSGFTFAKLKEGMKNAALEQDALAALQKQAASEHWKERIEKVKIESDAWAIQRNEQTGVVTGRVISVLGYAKWPDGHCTAQTFLLGQAHDGRRFAPNLAFSGAGEQQNIDCD